MALSNLPHPSPNTSIASSFSHIVTTKLTTENYTLWKVQIKAYLRAQDLYQFIDGSCSPPSEFLPNSTEPNPNFSSWKRTDQLVLSILFSSLSDSIIGHVLSFITFQGTLVIIGNHVCFPFLGQRISFSFAINQSHSRNPINHWLFCQSLFSCRHFSSYWSSPSW